MPKFKMRASFSKKCRWCGKSFVPNWSHVRKAWSEYCCKRCGQVGHYEANKTLVHPPFAAETLSELKALWDGGATCAELMSKYKVGDKYIRRELRRAGVDAKDFRPRGARGRRPTNARVYRFDAFSGRTPKTAYWAGFLMADGCVSVDGELSLAIHKQDASHLFAFADWIGLGRKDVYFPKARCGSGPKAKLHMKHGRFVDDLRRWGVVPRKTYHFVEPVVCDPLMPHFVRGWLDGDGTILFKRTKERATIVGNRLAMLWLANRIAECTFGRVSAKVCTKPEGKAWARVSVSGANNLLAFLEWMQPASSPSLVRKWNTARRWVVQRKNLLRKCKDGRVVRHNADKAGALL